MTAGIRNSIYDRKQTPGPGTYIVKLSSSAPKYKFGQYIPRSYQSAVPGPGTYQPNHEVARRPLSKRITFGVGERTCFANFRAPGPGAYKVSTRIVYPTVTTIRIATSSRNDTLNPYRTAGPGPGAYIVRGQRLTHGGKFHMARRRGIYSKSESPGPGAYRIPCTFAMTASYLIPNKEEQYKFV
eukprot:TRINITY_DN6885_c0_g1_i6.p2 TRINITY_DN6885_c0_g1~~TRINITY_DN6885_c0_g1_i6.p2  ORF type:complete len:184 (+),score=24.12 TRINITY_DN6885_c0_g1_i6:219-770(+)